MGVIVKSLAAQQTDHQVVDDRHSPAQLSRERKLAMADSTILATARAHQATLWTQGEHFKGLTGVKYIEKA